MGDALAEMMKQGSLYSRLKESWCTTFALLCLGYRSQMKFIFVPFGVLFFFFFLDGWKVVKRMEGL